MAAAEEKPRTKPVELDELDRGLLACLREDGRMQAVAIARRLETGEATVRRRLQRLQEQHGLKLVPVIDPDRVGLETCIFVGLKVEVSEIEAIAEKVRAMPEVRYLAYTTGPWDLLVEAFVGSRDHMAGFLIGSLGQLAGVRETDTFNVLEIAKFGYEWEVPHQDGLARRHGASIAHPENAEEDPS